MPVGLTHVIIGSLLIYFSYHALAGDQGLARWIELQRETVLIREEIASIRSGNAQLSQQLNRLRDGSIDLDYVEEIARKRLFMVHPDDRIIMIEGIVGDDSG